MPGILEEKYKEFMKDDKPNLKDYIDIKDGDGKTLLMYSAENDIQGTFIKRFMHEFTHNNGEQRIKAEEIEGFFEAKDKSGKSALMYSADKKTSGAYYVIIDFAIAQDKRKEKYLSQVVDAVDKKGKNALMYVLKHNDYFLVNKIVDYVNVNVRDKEGKTALNYALKSGNGEIVRMLHERGAKFVSEGKEYTIVDAEATLKEMKMEPREVIKVANIAGKADEYFDVLVEKSTNKNLIAAFVRESGETNLERAKIAFDNDKTEDEFKAATKNNLRKKQAELGQQIRRGHLDKMTNALGITDIKVTNRAELRVQQEEIGEVLRSGGMTLAGKVIDATYKAVGKKPYLGRSK